MHQPSIRAALRSLQRIVYIQGDDPYVVPAMPHVIQCDLRSGGTLQVCAPQGERMKPKHEALALDRLDYNIWRKQCDGEASVTPADAIQWFDAMDKKEYIAWLRMRTPLMDNVMCDALMQHVHGQMNDIRSIGLILLFGAATPREAIPARLRRYVYPIAPRTEGLPKADMGDPDPVTPEALRAFYLESCEALRIDVPTDRHPEIESLYAGLGLYEVSSVIAAIVINESGTPPAGRSKPVLDQLLDPALVEEYSTLWDRVS